MAPSYIGSSRAAESYIGSSSYMGSSSAIGMHIGEDSTLLHRQ